MKTKTVYFIRPIGMQGPIKIGCSISPDGRRSTLETWSPFPLEIIAEIEGGDDIEHRFHALFADQYERGEWFRWCPKFDNVVAAINEGRFDVATLPGKTKRTWLGRPKRSLETRQQLSLSLRVSHMISRTGYGAPTSTWDVITKGDTEALAKLQAYLADPIAHGIPIESEWAAKKRAEYLASLNPEGLAA